MRLGGSGQEGGKGGSLLALKVSQTIFIDKYLVLCKAAFGSFLVVKRWWRSGVDGGVEENGGVFSVSSSGDVSKTEVLCGSSKRWVSLALWGRLQMNGRGVEDAKYPTAWEFHYGTEKHLHETLGQPSWQVLLSLQQLP